jgi:hypothetical protein
MVHIGSVIEQEFHRQGRSASWFANQLCCDRTNVYSIFRRESIDSAMLFKISQILNHNFFDYYTKELSRVEK